MLQLALTIIIFLIIVIPVGRYMYHIATWNHTLADPVFDRLDGVIYKIGGVNPHQGMNWRQYALALVGTNAVMVAIGYLILRRDDPAGIYHPADPEHRAFQSQRYWRYGAVAFLQYHHQLHDQHEPAALLR